MKIPFDKKLDDLLIRLISAKDFTPHKVDYYQRLVDERKRELNLNHNSQNHERQGNIES